MEQNYEFGSARWSLHGCFSYLNNPSMLAVARNGAVARVRGTTPLAVVLFLVGSLGLCFKVLGAKEQLSEVDVMLP